MNNESTTQWIGRKQGWLYHLTPSSILRLRPSTCFPRYFLLYTTTKSEQGANLADTTHPKGSKVCYLAMFEQRSDARPPYGTPLAQLELKVTGTEVYVKNNSERKYFTGIAAINTNGGDASSMKERRGSVLSVAKKDDDRVFTIKTINGTSNCKWILQCADSGERDDWIQSILSTIEDVNLSNQVDSENSIELHDRNLHDQGNNYASGSYGIKLFGINILKLDGNGEPAIDNQLYMGPSVDVGMKSITMLTEKMDSAIKEHQSTMQSRANGT